MRRHAPLLLHVFDDAVAMDDEGLELPDVEAVRRVALKGARSLIAEEVNKGRLCLRHRIEVEDEDHRPVMTLPFAAAVQVDG